MNSNREKYNSKNDKETNEESIFFDVFHDKILKSKFNSFKTKIDLWIHGKEKIREDLTEVEVLNQFNHEISWFTKLHAENTQLKVKLEK